MVLNAVWVTDDQRIAADRFLDFLLAPAQQDRFQALGFRDHDGVPGPEISQDDGLLPLEPTSTLEPPSGQVLQAIRDTWPEYRKRARMLLVMDVSGSMSGVVAGSDLTKLQLAQAAALSAIEQLDPHDEVGLWSFSPASTSEPYVELIPVGRLSENEDQLRSAIQGLTADAGNRSDLYATVESAISTLRADFDGTKINGLVLLSDGPDEGSSNEERDAMITAVVPPGDDREVRIFTIAYGDQAETETLTALADASLGTAYDALDPADIGKVFYQVVANF